MRPLLLSLAIACTLATTGLYAQQLSTAVGVRFGSPTSLSVKAFITDESAVEVFAGIRPYVLQPYSYTAVGGAYLYHFGLDELGADLDDFSVYVGAGASAQFWRYDDEFFDTRLRRDFNDFGLRLGAYVGGQYVFPDTPLELTVDVSPSLVLGSVFLNGLRAGYYTLGARYIIGRRRG